MVRIMSRAKTPPFALVFAAGLTLATSVGHAQDSQARAEIQTLFNEANAELTDLTALYYSMSDRLSDWEEELQRTAALPLIDNQDGLQSQAARNLATKIVEHPLLPNTGLRCRDDLGALLIPGNVIDDNGLKDCARDVTLATPYLGRVDCGKLFWEAGPDGVLRLTGHVENPSTKTGLVEKFGEDIAAGVTEIPYPGCQALTTLELPLTSESRPVIRMLSNTSDIAFGESLAFEITTPDFFSFVYVIYLQADGAVFNLMPQRSLLRAQQDPRSRLRFGDGIDGRQTFTAQAPAGNEAIIAIAARSPIQVLDDLERPSDGQYGLYRNQVVNHPVFLEILNESMDDLSEEGRGRREISADVLPLTVRP